MLISPLPTVIYRNQAFDIIENGVRHATPRRRTISHHVDHFFRIHFPKFNNNRLSSASLLTRMKKQQFAVMDEGEMHSLKNYEKIGRPLSGGHETARQWRKKALVVFLIMCSIVLAVVAIFVGIGFFRSRNVLQDEETGLGGTRSSDLIESVCNKTLYFEACNSSLSSYPAAARANMPELARIAVEVSLKDAKGTADLSRKLKGNADGALQVCVEVLQNTVDELNASISVFARPNWKRRTEDVKAWLSAALTYPSTCIEGFEDVDEHMPVSLKQKLDNLSQLISNSLAIFNYVSAAEESRGTQKISQRNRRLLTYDGDFSVG
uniref:Pectin methylesterase inhibitor 1 n=1 Tax=Cunninghamia lanceolata TaxID=28977 RepID=A0A6G9W445_CUNLA|nr:pectin methylesterase inhibitor 1 [Cunninghamia lanceolata]